MGKRDRADELPPGVEDALSELQATLERGGAELKLRALDKVVALVDPADDTYTVQKALVAGDSAFFICELLADPSAATRAAEALAAICRHSAPALARLSSGPLVGLESSVERVSLNPCQSDFVDSGAMAALVPMLVARQEAAREAAAEAVATLCSYHQDGKLAYLEGLVQLLQRGVQPECLPQILELLDAAVDSTECSGDQAAQQLDLLLPPLLTELRALGRPSSASALALCATLCEKHPPAAEELRRGGAVEMAAQHVMQGPQQTQDVGARALWMLARGDRSCLRSEEGQQGKLPGGCDAVALAQVLVQLLEVAEAQEARAHEGESSGGEGDQQASPDAGAAAAAGLGVSLEPEVCFAEEASQLLKALGAAHPPVDAFLSERGVPVVRTQGCCIS